MVRGIGQMDSAGEGVGLFILTLALCTTVMFEQCQGRSVYEEPANCLRLECAPYQVIHSQKDYEIRSYRAATWISTSPIHSNSFKDAAGRGFNILFAYIQGNNDHAASINMTAPVLVDMFPSTGSSHNTTFTVQLYLPQKYQKNPPLSRQVHPVKMPEHRNAAVKRFGGFMNEASIPRQVLALRRSLKGSPWESSIAKTQSKGHVPCSVAGYNSPYEHENRVNEVMFWF
ncbi:hypothetical protein OIU84_023814 [Salix udensis]|uniref:SOUL heme-binding family protein n=1 Tax=Salix udensis TaxID=889485 RepID=A0AAD6PG02_9ROSI|nr:hypothetical protein OIU84_023814 [Salix udensis]